MDSIYERYRDRADFFTVYIREAHPTDEWQMTSNEHEDVCYPQPRTLEQRLKIANDFIGRFQYRIPLAVDPIGNPADRIYAGWPPSRETRVTSGARSPTLSLPSRRVS